jgi:hypothetical protein
MNTKVVDSTTLIKARKKHIKKIKNTIQTPFLHEDVLIVQLIHQPNRKNVFADSFIMQS